MRNSLLTLLASLLSISCFGQQWTDYQVDSIVTVRIPDNFQVIDTLGQRVVTAQIDNALIFITALENEGKTAFNIQDEKGLLDSYKGFQEGLIKSQNGQLIKDEIIEINGLKFLRFSFKATMGDEEQIRHCFSVFVNDRTYSINVWELESMANEMTPVRERLFNSVQFPATLTMTNQMSSSIEGSQTYNTSYFVGQLLGYVLIFTVLVYLVVWISKKMRRNSTNAQQKL